MSIIPLVSQQNARNSENSPGPDILSSVVDFTDPAARTATELNYTFAIRIEFGPALGAMHAGVSVCFADL